MANPYDDVVASMKTDRQGAAPGGANPYDGVLDDIQIEQQKRTRYVFEKALSVNPDAAAEAKKLANQTGLAPDVVARNLDEVRRKEQARMLDLARMAEASQVLARQLADPEFTKQAHDDIGTLTQIAQFFKDTGNSMKAGVLNANKGAAGVLRAGTELLAPILDPLESVTSIGGNPLRRLSEGFAANAAQSDAAAKAVAPKTQGNISSGFQSGVQSLTQNLLALPLAFMPGGQTAALSMMTASTGGQSYQDARAKGLSMAQSLPYAASQATVEYVTEKLPLGQLIGDIKKTTPILQTIAKQMALEIPGEQVATILQDLNDWAVLNPEKSFRSYIEERPDAAVQTLVATIVGTGGNVAVSKGIETATRKMMGDAYDAGTSEQAAEMLKQQLATATQSKLRERNPEEFRNLMQRMVEGTEGAPAEVFVDAEVLNQLAPEILQQLPQNVRDQLPDALATNDVVGIPVGDVLTIAPGTELEQMLVDNARVGDPRAMTRTEAQQAGDQAQQYLATEAQRVIEQANDQQAMQDSADRVKQSLLDQLNTAGRFRNDVNEAYATWTTAFYTTMAGRLGLNPEEMAARYPLKIAAQSEQAGAQLEQRYTATTGPADDASMRDLLAPKGKSSTVGDEKGKTTTDGVSKFVSQFGSTRYVYSEDGKALAVLQVMSRDGKTGTATNVYTLPEARRRGLATGLMQQARKDFKQFEYSTDLSPDGAGLVTAVENIRLNQTKARATFNPATLAEVQQQWGVAGIKSAVSERDGTIMLSQIVVPKEERSGGKGTSAMQALIDYADRTGQRVVLSPSSDFGGSKKRLVEFYKRFGFVENKGRNKDFTTMESMIREPQSLAQKVDQTETPEFKNWFGESKVVDADGKPLVVYHGTNAHAYSPGESIEVFNTRPTSGRGGAFFTDSQRLAEQYGERVYNTYLSMQNPLVVYADGKGWTTISGKSRVGGGITDTARQESERDAKKMSDVFAELAELFDEPAETVTAKAKLAADATDLEGKTLGDLPGLDGESLETDAVVKAARRLGYDGVIFKNVQDSPTSDAGYERVLSDVFAVFNPTQIKSATGNSGAFDPNDPSILAQTANQTKARATFNPATLELVLNANANLSSYLHETGHFFLEVMADLANQPNAPAEIADDMNKLLAWFGVTGGESIIAPVPEGYVRLYRGQPKGGFPPSVDWVQGSGPSEKGRWFSTDKADADFYGMNGVVRYVDVPEDVAASATAEGMLEKSGRLLPAEWANKAADLTKTANTPLETWMAMTLDQKRKYHERFAESMEQYLLEGKAPSVELQPLFRKFRAWMLNVYKSLKQFVSMHPESGIVLSDEIRQVFDRMVASAEQIAQAEESAGLLPDENATDDAIEKLTARSLRDLKWTVNARAKEIKKLQKQAAEMRKGVEAEVRAEVEAMPVYAAQLSMRGENKLDIGALAEMYAGEGDRYALLDWKPLVDRKLAGKTGVHPDILADSFGYASGDEMVRAVLAAEPMKSVIQGMTDQRMLERHGDLIDDRAIAEAANEAVHNEARARSLATELKSQADMLNRREDTGTENAAGNRVTVNVIAEAAKQFAANVIARTPLRDLKSRATQHVAAERRAGKRWQEATAAGKTQDAVKAKQDQVLNNAAAKAALEAQQEAKKIIEFFRRVVKDGNEKTVERGRDPDVVNAARAVLAAYGVAPRAGKSALEYMEIVQRNDPAMYAALNPSIQGALNSAQPLDALTMEELRGLNEEIQAMWHLAKRSRQMEVDGNLMDIEDAEDELKARMQEVGVPDTVPGQSGALTKREEAARKLQFAGSLLRRVESWAEAMDGKFGGPFLRLVFQPVKEAADRYRADRVMYRKAYQELIDKVAPYLKKGVIEAPELGYTFGRGHNGIGHAELLHAILHTGNDSNKRKLLLGREWATENPDGTLDTRRWDAFIERMQSAGTLTKEHYDFAQGVWDLLEQTKPLAQKTHRDVFGRYFAEVTANEVTTPFGTYRGGYVPAQADPRIVLDADMRKLAEAENENMAFSFPTTNKGFTQSRVDYNRPLMLDLRSIGQHLDKVLLFAHMEPAVRDVQKLLTRKGVSYQLGRIDPTIFAGMLTPWLNRSARQTVETPVVGDGGLNRILSVARNRAGMALMFANVSNTLQQLTGFSLAAVKVKPSHMMRATAQMISSPRKTSKTVSEASAFMANRMENEISAINDAMDQILLDPSLYEKSQAWAQKHAYFLQTAMAASMEPIIWTGAYNQALSENMSEKDAVRFADNVIRTTQGSTLPEDVSRMETGPSYARAFTQFVGYFNMMANTNATALQQLAREVGLRKGAGKALGIVTLGFLAPIWVAEIIALAMRGGPKDEDDDGYLDDWLAAVFGIGTIKGTLAMVPFVGQLGNAAISRFNNNPADDRMSLSPAVSLLEATVGVPSDIYKAITDPDKLNARNAVRDVASAVSIVTGLPAYAIARPAGYLAGVEDDRINPTGPVDMARGIVTGTPSPQSR